MAKKITNLLKDSQFVPLLRALRSNIYSVRLNYEATDKNILFIWIPKTAGTSVFKFFSSELRMQNRNKETRFLSFQNRGAVTFEHVSYQQLLALGAVSKGYHEKAYKFCIVRNPYTRAVSLYNYLVQVNRLKSGTNFIQFLTDVHLFRQPIGLYNAIGISQTNPQADWVVGLDGRLVVDDVFKIENLEAFAKAMTEKFNVEFDPLSKENVSNKILSIDEAYSDSKCAELVRIIYKRDFDLFDYCEYTIPTHL